MSIPKLGIYEHYKGKRYEVLGLAKHTETLEELVAYKNLSDDSEFWVRPLKMFLEDVKVNGKIVPRFKKIN
jgi:cyclomaltodextrinase / maltogenic alpha-amylase / neopullulanase